MKKKVLLPILLAAMAFPLCLHNEPASLNAEYIGEYMDDASYKAYGSEVNHQMADEGFVLLKNDGFLPMKPGKATLAGKAAFNLAKGGAGSGSSSASSGVDDYTLQWALEDVGFEVNTTLKAFYGSNQSGNKGRWTNNSASGPGRTNGNDGWKGNSQVQIGETPVEYYSDELIASMDEYNDVAIQVITREGSEGCDVKAIDARDFDPRGGSSLPSGWKWDEMTTKHALELSDNEADLLELLKQHFDHVIVVINSSNIFECEALENDPQVSGILWIGNPGDVGPAAVGRILTGEVNPSGRTVDTWARSFRNDPTFQNFSDNAQTNTMTYHVSTGSGTDTYAPQDTMFNADGTPTRSYGTDKAYSNTSSPRWADQNAKVVQGGINGVKPSAYVSYEEDIYLDYRYYETRYADMALEDKASADEWYNGDHGVLYPFGYGLSYTKFEQKIVKINPAKGATLDENSDLIEVSVKVTNKGKVAGKDAVQLYWKAPYYQGEIEKADHVLCAFDKTGEIKPGKSEIVHLTFHLQDVANYDFLDSNNNNFAGYELDGGDYSILLGKNAHEMYDEAKFSVVEGGIQYENDRFTGHKVENRFTNRGFYNSMPENGDLEFTRMSRANFEETFPTHPTFETRKLGANSRFEEFLTHEFSVAELDEGNFDYVPEAAHKTEADATAGGWAQNGNYQIKLQDMKDVAWEDDAQWDRFLNGFKWDDMLTFVENNRMSSPGLSSVGKSGFSEGDGPQKFSIMQWVSSPIIAATFNPKLAHKQGECVGIESHLNGKSGWWGPGVNTHRSPFGGRNFEYYSADPFLMGRMAALVVGAATDRGVYAYFKHFVVNDQEKNRESGISYLTEQAFREIYLKSFQMVFEEGKSIGVMSSYNRIGLMETAASYPLLTEVLRGEWGFKGAVLSDMTHSGNGSVNFKCYENINNRILAGCNSQLDSGGFSGNSEAKWDSTLKAPAYTNKSGQKVVSYSYWYAVRQMIKGIMYMSVRATQTWGNRDNKYQMVEVADEIQLNYKPGQQFSYKIANPNVGDEEEPVEFETAEYKLNDRIVLPEGVEFDDQSGELFGAIEHVGLYRVDIILTNANGQKVAVKLVINVAPKVSAGGGCGGSIASVGALISLIAVAGVGVILLSLRKRRRA